jgi:hypothetical protein
LRQGRAGKLGSREPGQDPPNLLRLHVEQPHATVKHRPTFANEAGIPKQLKLARHRRSTEAELRGQLRRPPRARRQRDDDPAPGQVGKEGDALAISSGHVGHVADDRPPPLPGGHAGIDMSVASAKHDPQRTLPS